MVNKTVVASFKPDTSYQTGEYPDNSTKVISKVKFSGDDIDILSCESYKKKIKPSQERRSFKSVKNIGNYKKGGF